MAARFNWARFDAQPLVVKAVVWDWNADVRFLVAPGSADGIAAALRLDVERKLGSVRAEGRRRGRRVRSTGFERFMPGGA
jgi:hypothetical protein